MDLAAAAAGDRGTRMSLSRAGQSRSDLELRGLNDYASTGSGPTRQSDARDSEPLHVSAAGARAGSLLFDTRSFFLCDGNSDANL